MNKRLWLLIFIATVCINCASAPPSLDANSPTVLITGANRGLGLSVVADILGNVDGQIKFMDNGGGGAVFEVLIPLKSKDSES